MGLQAGMALLQSGQWERGAAELHAALANDPGHPAAWSNLGFALRQLRRNGEARAALERAIGLDPQLADAWNLLGLVDQDEGRHEQARTSFERALALRPGFAQARMNLANADQALGRVEAALAGYAEALRLDPKLAEAHYNLGHLHDRAGRIEVAERHYADALRIDPGYAMARLNLAHVLMRAGRLDESIDHASEVVRLQPRFATAQIQLAHYLFLAGRFGEAWQHNTWRESRNAHALASMRAGREYAVPAMHSLRGADVDVIGEQGLGDNLFFLRFAPALVQAGSRLRFVGDARLHPLLARTGLFDGVVESASLQPQPLGILAGDLALLTPSGHVPPALPLPPDPARMDAMRRRLDALGAAPRIASAGRSGVPHGGSFATLYKELPLAAFGEALRGTKATWISIQRDPREGELAALSVALGSAVHDFSQANVDLDDALALMELADEYVGVSSTNVHLRAGAGRTSRVLVPFPPEWRWMMQGGSAWFPGTAAYRQQADGDWRPALRELARDLAALAP